MNDNLIRMFINSRTLLALKVDIKMQYLIFYHHIINHPSKCLDGAMKHKLRIETSNMEILCGSFMKYLQESFESMNHFSLLLFLNKEIH